mmetsp:Transcript_4245/g.4971  ORF Transcript_4245/g.4971 Transcript_4245/m.4971 type:complete len:398 (+) Transcript_4245:350-1543(+)|eukprot:CAMPEP_0204824298 /NCGR_PEP_ID=MMETSP1346-20131115/2320_1 /ASSEMBLY_ACC=CAM_ASM_000771 /TAXON_ID=215587 /ORGANISM="Aplanochytrium stocchinoi, Strain GSBS06" /LENGTH=397 /DNA_ID=CAMNT_0051951379 /DNA_START=303 /DNA_END=1496 /DNA_ORIENTATION=+
MEVTDWVLVKPSTSNAELTDVEKVKVSVSPATPEWESQGSFELLIPKFLTEYDLRPVHRGKAVFLNPRNKEMYDLTLSEPKCVIWILTCGNAPPGYVLKRIWESCFARNIQCTFVVTSKFELFATEKGLDKLTYDGKEVSLPDLVLSRVGARVDYFGLAVVRHLETIGITVINDVASIEISKDKLQTMQVLGGHGLPIPKTMLAKFPIPLDVVKQNFTLPMILKRVSGLQGKGIMIIRSYEHLDDLVDLLDTKEPLVFQEFIEASTGKDIRVLVVGGRIVGCMMRIAQTGFKANIHQGAKAVSVNLTAQAEWLCLEAARLTGLDIAGIDLLIDSATYKICEINSSPGFEGLEQSTGQDIAAAMVNYMKLRMGLWRKTRPLKLVDLEVPVSVEHATKT